MFQPPAESLQSIPRRRCLANYRLHDHTGYLLLFCADSDEGSDIKSTLLGMIDSFRYR